MTTVEIVGRELRIDGVPRVLLCASVFPFRLPPERWRERARAVVALGYDAIDVYVPWNEHERSPGEWDFSGGRDLDAFLAIARDEGLLVVARPGPYICSEWDGGGLPAWLTLKEGMRLRQADPVFLSAVEEWFSRVLPILAAHQVSAGGAVAVVQLENELDFFDCDDPAGYVGALADLARRFGITVPLVACAGQGDVARATGDVPGVVPAVNLYPSDESPNVEALAAYADAALRERGYPLLVTETNRAHRTLKRLVPTGARLLGPYLQTSGWNFDGGTAANNWGEPLAFLTHDYDFGGVIDPAGRERADAAEGRRLAALIRALGPRLAAGTPNVAPSSVRGETGVAPAALALAGGGQLISLTRLESDATQVTLGPAGAEVDVDVPGQTTLLLVTELPLGPDGIRLEAASAEIQSLESSAGAVRLGLVARGPEQVALTMPGEVEMASWGDVRVRPGAPVRVAGTSGGCRLRGPSGVTVEVEFVPAEPDPRPISSPVRELAHVASGPANDPGWQPAGASERPVPIEHLAVYDGAVRFTASAPAAPGGLVIRGAADIVDVSVGARPGAWHARAGTDLWLPDSVALAGDPLTVTSRVWGHSNFDDSRLPALRLGSLKGARGVLAVERTADVSSGWIVVGASGPRVGRSPAPPCDLGGWMSSVFPQDVLYRRAVRDSEAGDVALHAPLLGATLRVRVDGAEVGIISPAAPTLWVGRVEPGAMIEVAVHREWGEPVGPLTLLTGCDVVGWRAEVRPTRALVAAAPTLDIGPTSEIALPVSVPAGGSTWVGIPGRLLDNDGDTVVRVDGEGLLVTAIAGGRQIARLWLGGIPGATTTRGGRGDLVLVPRGWGRDGLALLLEATRATPGRMTAVRLGGPLDLPGDEA